MNFGEYKLVAVNDDIIEELLLWKYEKPYNIYNLHLNNYLLNKDRWGNEQFALVNDGDVIGQVACQIIDDNMWVGWSLKPDLCGSGIGDLFIKKCIDELISLKKYSGEYIFLKVVDWNNRAIKAYEKAGFMYYRNTERKEDDKLVRYFIMKKAMMYLDN